MKRIKTTVSACVLSLLGTLIGCQAETGTEAQNNGSAAPLTNARSKVTGALIIRNASLMAISTHAKCKAPPAGPAEGYAADCSFYMICSATLVKDAGATQPFVVSAAHCDPSEDLAMDVSKRVKGGIQGSPLPAAGSSAIASKVYFYQPSSKTWLELEGWKNHPQFTDNVMDGSFSLSSSTMHPDIAVARIAAVDMNKAKAMPAATIETKIPKLSPAADVAAKFESDLDSAQGIDNANDGLTSFITTFDRKAFDSYPSAELLGFGLINNTIASSVGISKQQTKWSCKLAGGVWIGMACRQEESTSFETPNGKHSLTLRSVHLKVAYSNAGRALAAFLAPASNPKAGTCQGDSGGPSFLGNDGSTRLFAVESYGPPPCAGAPTARTLVAPHLKWILQAVRG